MATAARQMDEAADRKMIEDFCDTLSQKYGSLIKAWRRVLDPNRYGELLFNDFVEALARAGFHGDTSALWMALLRRARGRGREYALGLAEFSPEANQLVEKFKQWAADSFGGVIDMFRAMNSSPTASVSIEAFVDMCTTHGYQGDASRMYTEALDLHSSGNITIEDVAFLERDAFKRRSVVDPSFLTEIDKGKAMNARLREREAVKRETQHAAVREFRQRVRAANSGSFIRGWRKILDLDGNMIISKCEVWKACRQIDFKGDVAALWKAMDLDDDGAVHLHELEVGVAMALARFKLWILDKFQAKTCVTALQNFAMMTKKRSAKWTVEEFCKPLLDLDPPTALDWTPKQVLSLVHEACDLAAIGVVVPQDAGFLDRWDPCALLCADQDPKGTKKFIKLLQYRYGSLTIAWRRVLDVNNKNRVSFKEFSDACKAMNLQNSASLWRTLDDDASGFITLDEIDHYSSDCLLGFKEWAEQRFGTIICAYKMLDSSRSNAMSYSMWKRALQDFGFEGDARVLFQIFKPEGGRDSRLTLDDVRYLSTWEPPETEQEEEEVEEGASAAPSSSTASNHASKPNQDEAASAGAKKVRLPPLPSTPPAAIEKRLATDNRFAYSRFGTQFSFCRCADEYKELNKLRQSCPDIHATRKKFDMTELINLSPSATRGSFASEPTQMSGSLKSAGRFGLKKSRSQASPYAVPLWTAV